MLFSNSTYSDLPFSATKKSEKFTGEIFFFDLNVQYNPLNFDLHILY